MKYEDYFNIFFIYTKKMGMKEGIDIWFIYQINFLEYFFLLEIVTVTISFISFADKLYF